MAPIMRIISKSKKLKRKTLNQRDNIIDVRIQIIRLIKKMKLIKKYKREKHNLDNNNNIDRRMAAISNQNIKQKVEMMKSKSIIKTIIKKRNKGLVEETRTKIKLRKKRNFSLPTKNIFMGIGNIKEIKFLLL
jgi:hypothetical protein